MKAINQMDQAFLTEYSSDAAVRKYSHKTAGKGISYLLDHEYGPLYVEALQKHLKTPIGSGVRILEFGCGAGMNLIHCLGMLKREKIPVVNAYGTDFSERLIEEAGNEAQVLPEDLRKKVKFMVARSERLGADMAAALKVADKDLRGSFHLIIGVNTFRYCYRLGLGEECAREVYSLLKPGGVCVNIDMNNKFPAFRTLLRDRLTKPEGERYLPSLAEYAAPFASAGFEILERKNFCWVPHSAGPGLLAVCKTLTPVLNTLMRSRAMRSLVVARKPL